MSASVQVDETASPVPVRRSRAKVLDVLRAADRPVPATVVADQVGLHLNSARFHLEQLVRQRLAERSTEARQSPGRPRSLYRALPVPTAERRNYRLLAGVLAGSLADQDDPAKAAADAGRRWGRSLVDRPDGPRPSPDAATAALVGALDDAGFAAEAVTVGRRRRVLLHRCPFLEIAQRNPEVVCAVHLGLMQGVLEQLRAPVVTDRLEPFVEPTLCVTRLASSRRGRPEPVLG